MNKIVDKIKKHIGTLTSMGERQGKVLDLAKEYIVSQILNINILCDTFSISTEIPIGSSTLFIDGKKIASMPTSYVSGKINSNFAMVSSLVPSRYLIDIPNINFNPVCSIISRSNMYFAPAIAICRDDVKAVIDAKKVSGVVNIKKTKVINPQIVVGSHTPEVLIFSHYDSIGKGTVDNASGTALMLELLANNPDTLKKSLFVFDGNEELSYDYPTYWGRGYREFFSKTVGALGISLKKVKKIIVADCLGYSKTISYTSEKITDLAFPVPSVMLPKGSLVEVLSGSYENLMPVYHSDLDNGSNIQDIYLIEAYKILSRKIS